MLEMQAPLKRPHSQHQFQDQQQGQLQQQWRRQRQAYRARGDVFPLELSGAVSPCSANTAQPQGPYSLRFYALEIPHLPAIHGLLYIAD